MDNPRDDDDDTPRLNVIEIASDTNNPRQEGAKKYLEEGLAEFINAGYFLQTYGAACEGKSLRNYDVLAGYKAGNERVHAPRRSVGRMLGGRSGGNGGVGVGVGSSRSNLLQ